jgi:hypothetical protein
MGVEVWLNHSLPRHNMEASSQLHAPAALTPEKQLPVPTG